MQWKSAKGAKAVDGTVSDKRAMEGGTADVKAEGSKSGDTYTVTFTRKLAGGIGFGRKARAMPFGVAIHADHAVGRFHHISFGYMLGIGAEGDEGGQAVSLVPAMAKRLGNPQADDGGAGVPPSRSLGGSTASPKRR